MFNPSIFTLISGPCAIENRDHTLFMADNLKKLTEKHNIPFIFKSSFDKANRTSLHGKRGVGIDEGLKILQEVKTALGCLTLTDVHDPAQCVSVADVVDVLQIPALLCRQTDLLEAAAKTKKPVQVKKGQFLAPWDMKSVVEKLEGFGCQKIILCERGTSFGYNTLINDMRGLSIMAQFGHPIVFDATHSVQKPGGLGYATSGERIFAPILARAALAVGINGIFAEVHDDPDHAPSDGPNMIRLDNLDQILKEWKAIDQVSRQFPRKL